MFNEGTLESEGISKCILKFVAFYFCSHNNLVQSHHEELSLMLSYFNKSSADVVNKFEIGSFRGYSAPLEEKYAHQNSIPNNLYA